MTEKEARLGKEILEDCKIVNNFLTKDTWTAKAYGRDDEGNILNPMQCTYSIKACLIGAFYRISYPNEAEWLITRISRQLGFANPEEMNDMIGFAEVKKFLGIIIEHLERQVYSEEHTHLNIAKEIKEQVTWKPPGLGEW